MRLIHWSSLLLNFLSGFRITCLIPAFLIIGLAWLGPEIDAMATNAQVMQNHGSKVLGVNILLAGVACI